MEIKEFRELSPKDLDLKIADLKQQLFELRRKKAVGQLEHAEQVRGVRKDIAKAETVKRQRELQIPEPKAKEAKPAPKAKAAKKK
ncbi:MAG: 50S ribosomal protein L29 [Bacilli bacterium]|jgi:large subunit ribosomal protein L29|nr:50S ribosomal protein L29 [Bacilli bacterium]MCI2111011.1 50S ribosomal protein L29 [Bacilli bacterium]